MEKQTLTNAAGSSLETNAPVRVGMSDHNLRIAINQRNKGCRNNEMDETILNHASALIAGTTIFFGMASLW